MKYKWTQSRHTSSDPRANIFDCALRCNGNILYWTSSPWSAEILHKLNQFNISPEEYKSDDGALIYAPEQQAKNLKEIIERQEATLKAEIANRRKEITKRRAKYELALACAKTKSAATRRHLVSMGGVHGYGKTNETQDMCGIWICLCGKQFDHEGIDEHFKQVGFRKAKQ